MGRREILITVGVILFIVVFVVLFILSRIQPTTNTANSKNTNSSKKAATVVVNKNLININDIINDPLVYDGLTIEAESKVTDWVTKRAFTVGTSGGFLSSGGKKLLVVRKTNFRLPKDTKGTELGLGETVNVKLKGKVRIMDKIELGKLMGIDLDGSDIKLDDGSTASFREGSVLILDSVEKI